MYFSLYTRIIELINQNNMNGVDYGKLLGLQKSPLTDWKNGKSKPTLEQVIKTCEIFGISSDYLLFENTQLISPEVSELITTYKKLDSRGKYKVQTTAYDELDRMNGILPQKKLSKDVG